VVGNKLDEPQAEKNLEKLKNKLKLPIFGISCLTEEGIEPLTSKLLEMIQSIRAEDAEADSR